MSCIVCGGSLHRCRRSLLERLLYEAVVRCSGCQRRFTAGQSWTFMFRTYVNCPKCGQTRLDRRRTQDGIDRVYKSPLSWLQRFLFAPIYHCRDCRIQFYDWRPRKSTQRESISAAAGDV